jgi:hypothetical protein
VAEAAKAYRKPDQSSVEITGNRCRAVVVFATKVTWDTDALNKLKYELGPFFDRLFTAEIRYIPRSDLEDFLARRDTPAARQLARAKRLKEITPQVRFYAD